MDEIELNNIDKGWEEEGRTEQDREREETSFTERTEEAEDDYDNIRSRISPEPTDQSKTNEGLDADNIPTLPNVGEYKRIIIIIIKVFIV